MTTFDAIANHIQQITDQRLTSIKLAAISGGGINEAYHLKSDEQSYFIKLNTPLRVQLGLLPRPRT